MTYAFGHGKELLHRSIRQRMGVARAPRSGAQQARTTENSQLSRDPQRYLLHPKERLPLEVTTPGLSALGDCLLVVQQMAHRRDLRAAQRRAARACAISLGKKRSSERGHRRLLAEAKTTGVGGEERGYDGGKKVRGRERHLLVDTEGLVLKAKVHTAPRCPTRTA